MRFLKDNHPSIISPSYIAGVAVHVVVGTVNAGIMGIIHLLAVGAQSVTMLCELLLIQLLSKCIIQVTC